MNFDSLARDLSLSPNAVRSHAALLDTLFLTTRLEAWSANLLSRVVKNPKAYIADRSQAAASVSPADFRGLRHLRDRLGDRFKAGVLLYTGESTVPFGDRLAAVSALRTVGRLMSAIRLAHRVQRP